MCGIFGVVLASSGEYTDSAREKAIRILAREAQSRGRDSSGLVFREPASDRYTVFKGAMSIRALQRDKSVERARAAWRTPPAGGEDRPFVAIGHSRLVTNGSQLSVGNNQPVVKDGIAGVHNGIIVNDSALWYRHPELTREFEIDTEVFQALVRKRMNAGLEVAEAIMESSKEVQGTLSVALLIPDRGLLALFANYGSLYLLTNDRDALFFASEYHPLDVLRSALALGNGRGFVIRQVPPDTGVLCGLQEFAVDAFGPDAPRPDTGRTAVVNAAIEVRPVGTGNGQRELVQDVAAIARAPEARKYEALLESNRERVALLKRCAACVLPETFPFIAYDDNGVCNYCRNYRIRNQPKPMEELLRLIGSYRRDDGEPDCIVPFSGGRDSTYALHFIKTELGLNPIAFTYDWGMVTDLGRRNIARVCGKLGVENIIVAADIHWKRRNIRKNLLAWLRRPHLGMIPLLMAGDKYFYYYVDQVKRQTGIRLNIWGINPMENTDFKVGFLGVPPDFQKKHIYSLSFARQIRLLQGVGSAIVTNPAYINASVPDTVGSFLSRSVKPHRDYYHLFDYLHWDEESIDRLILDEYGWEKAIDTETTWRIGDGTAAFYNYAYYTVAGFSEHDTFRSNQIREGVLDRKRAMDMIAEENRPRYPTIRWYLDAVGIDFASAIQTVNNVPKLYA